MWVVLVDDVEAGVGHEYLGNADSFGSLVVFEQSSYDARQSESRTVEGVAERDFLVCVTVAAVQAVCLIAFEI